MQKLMDRDYVFFKMLMYFNGKSNLQRQQKNGKMCCHDILRIILYNQQLMKRIIIYIVYG